MQVLAHARISHRVQLKRAVYACFFQILKHLECLESIRKMKLKMLNIVTHCEIDSNRMTSKGNASCSGLHGHGLAANAFGLRASDRHERGSPSRAGWDPELQSILLNLAIQTLEMTFSQSNVTLNYIKLCYIILYYVILHCIILSGVLRNLRGCRRHFGSCGMDEVLDAVRRLPPDVPGQQRRQRLRHDINIYISIDESAYKTYTCLSISIITITTITIHICKYRLSVYTTYAKISLRRF